MKNLYKEYDKENPVVGGNNRRQHGIPRKYLMERKRCFSKYQSEISSDIEECKKTGLSREETREYLHNKYDNQDNVYGFSIVTFVITQIVLWLIKKLIDRYFNDLNDEIIS